MSEQLKEKLRLIIKENCPAGCSNCEADQEWCVFLQVTPLQILIAIEEGIEICGLCGAEREAPTCKACGGKGWVFR